MKRFLVCVFAFLLGASAMLAQLPTGTILGVVKDSSGAVVPGANVTARQTETNQSRSQTTGQDGAYRFDQLPVGTYEITVTANGFSTDVQSGLVLSVGQEAVSNFSLQVGAVSQTISVSAEATSLVDTTTSSLGSLVNQQQITDLPLNGRNYNDLTLLQTGVTKSLNSNNATIGYNGTAYSSNGAPQRSNMYLLDGAIQNSLSGNNGSSALGTTLGVDGILEYKVITNSFDAQYGMTMGSQETVVSKSGTNSFHGDAFDFLRNSVFDARNYFDLPPSRLGGHRNPEFRRNQFGGSLGGPIQKDKTFFFATYEGLRAFLDTTNTTTTLGTLANPNGCHGSAGAVITAAACPQLGSGVNQATIAPQMAPFIALWPAPNLPGTSNNYGFIFDQVTPEDYGQIRIDHTLSNSDSIFGRYTIDQSSLPFVGNFNSNYAVEHARNQFLTLAENHIFSASLVNSVRASFSREPLQYDTAFSNPLLTTQPYEFVSTPGYGMGSLGATGVGGIGDSILAPRNQKENIFTVSDDVDYNHGRHSFKFGVLFNHYQYNVITHGYDRAIISFTTLGGLMQGGLGPLAGETGTASTYAMNSFSLTLPSADNVRKDLHFDTMGFYGQDSWKIWPRLTLNIGMRYEPTTDVNEIHGNASILRDFPASSAFTVGNPVFRNPSLRNWSPRFGFAYDVFGNGKTAIRGGFDVLYDLATFGQNYMNYAGYDPPFSDNISITNYTQQFGVLLTPATVPNGNYQFSYRGPVWNENQPHLLSYNFTVEQQLPGQMSLSLAYAGSHGINLVQVLEGNNVLPSGIPGLDSHGNYACILQPAGTVLNLANQYDGTATSCYANSTTTLPQCWPAQGITANCYNRLNSNLPSMIFNPSTGESFYNALEVNLNKRVTAGLQFQGAFTWAKLNDNQQGGSGQDGNDIAREPLHTGSLYGPALFDIRDSFHFNALYSLPNFRSSKGFLSGITNGWRVSGILSLQTGYPFSVVYSGDRENIGYTTGFASRDTPDLVPGRTNNNITHGVSTGCAGIAAGTPLHTVAHWYDPCAFTIQPAGFIGTEPRNFLRGPGLADFDASLTKDTKVSKLGEAGAIEFRAEVFDFLNHPNFSLPNQTVSGGSCASGTVDTLAACPITVSNGSGAIGSTLPGEGGVPQGSQRQIQFGLKVMF